MLTRSTIAFGVLGLVLGCSSTSTNPGSDSKCPTGKICDSGKPSGPPHPLRADNTVEITPAEAWPNRAVEEPPLTREETLGACAALATCGDLTAATGATLEDTRRLMQAICLKPPQGSEERAIPISLPSPQNERWTFQAREVLKAQGNCDAVKAAATEREPEIYCEEVGCWWKSKVLPVPEVSCSGDVANLTTGGTSFTRDCARALAHCDEASPTGCTDRAPTGCVHPASDRCDGNVRLGCDGTGRVSFRDCSRVTGGTCGDIGDGPNCIYPDTECSGSALQGCNGTKLELCVLGTITSFDCAVGGFANCTNGLCVPN